MDWGLELLQDICSMQASGAMRMCFGVEGSWVNGESNGKSSGSWNARPSP